MTISLFLCILGLWIWDTYFSVYIENIVLFGFWVSLFWSVYPLTKLLVVTTAWKLNDQWKSEELIYIWKAAWILSWLFYYLAWVYTSWILLLIWIILSWIAGALIYPSYWTLYKKSWTLLNQWKVFWYHQTAINLWYCFGALICAGLIVFLDLPYIFLFMSFFIVISLFRDDKLRHKARRHWKDPKKFSFFWEEWAVTLYFKHFFTSTPLRTVYKSLKNYKGSMYSALWAQALINLMEYVWFLFIPIIAVENDLNLVQIAIITFVMWLPNILNIYAGNLSDQYNKKLLIGCFLLVGGIFYVLLWCHDSFIAILAITFWIAFVIAFIFPMVSALISEWIREKEEGSIAWVKEYIATCWEIIWSLWFWLFISLLGIQWAFMFFWIILILLSVYIIIKKLSEKARHKNR